METPKGELPPQSPENQERVGQKWEYRLLYTSTSYDVKRLDINFQDSKDEIPGKSEHEREAEVIRRMEDLFNRLGDEGWELINNRSYAYGSLNIFKRPTPSTETQE